MGDAITSIAVASKCKVLIYSVGATGGAWSSTVLEVTPDEVGDNQHVAVSSLVERVALGTGMAAFLFEKKVSGNTYTATKTVEEDNIVYRTGTFVSISGDDKFFASALNRNNTATGAHVHYIA